MSGSGFSWSFSRVRSLLLGSLFVAAAGCDSDIASTGGALDEPTPPTVADVVPPELGNPSDLSASASEMEAPPETLGIGDPNPGLHLAKWVKGESVDLPLKDKVHVVEFWATWCGPCRVGMPHISELQTEYGDEVAFIGVTREDEDTVTNFMQSDSPSGETWDEVIKYRIALDDNSWTNNAYMKAAGQNGIPCAFVVGRDGVVEWIGHPARIDDVLKQVVDGSWDREAAIASRLQEKQLQEAARELSGLMRQQNWDAALAKLDELESASGKSVGLLQMRLRILKAANLSSQADEVQKEIVEEAWDDANILNQIAWDTATAGGTPDLELALKAAERASELREHKDAAVLDTVARCYYELGNLDKAIEWQQQAKDRNDGYPEIAATLKKYQQEKAKADSESEPSDDE